MENIASKTIVKPNWIIKVSVSLLVFGMILFWVWRISFDRTGDIMADLAKYDGKTVYLLGTAKTPISLPFVGSIYKLDDGSGEIWVFSQIDSTPAGKRIFIKGVVKARVNKDKIDIVKIFGDKFSPLLLEKAGPVIEEKERGGLLSSLEMIWKRH